MGYIGKVPADVLIDPMVDSAAITDATIVTADLANDAVTSAKLAADSVDSSELIDGSVDNAHLAGSIAMNKTNLTAGTGLTLSTDTLNVDAAQTQITSVGTIGTGVWNGTAIASAYLDSDTAHLSGTQTFSGEKTFSADVTLSGAKLLVAASAQGIFGAADGDTGIRWEGSNVLAIDTNGSERMHIDANGDVKITERLTVGSWDDSNTHGHAYIDISSDANEGADSCLYFGAGTTVKGSIYYNHNATAASQQMYFVTGDNSTNSLILDNSSATFAGKVFINQDATNAYAFEIDHEGDAYNGLHVDASALTTGSAGHFYSDANRTADYPLVELQDDNASSSGYGLKIRCDGDGDFIRGMAQGNNTKWVVKNDGSMGIGTGSPDHKLHLKFVADAAFAGDSDLDGESIMLLEGSNSDNEATMIRFKNHGSMNNYFGVHQVGASGPGDFVWTAFDGSSYNERFRVKANGNVFAKQLNQTGTTSNRYPLYWVHSGSDGSIEPYTGSVRAMKTDISDMGSVDWINSLKPRSFKFRDFEDIDGVRTYKDTTNDNPITEYGLVAEEVDEVEGSDYIVDKDSDGKVKGVLYHNLVPILLKALQEQNERIKALENA